MTLANAIEDANTDILGLFAGLSSGPKLEAIEKLVDSCGQAGPPLRQHRYKVTLARLIEEFGAKLTTPCADFDRLRDRCFKSKVTAEVPPSGISRSEQAKYIADQLRAGASHHLRDAILECFPRPNRVPSQRGIWSLKNYIVKVGAPVRLDLGMGGISDIPPYCMEREGNCISLPIRFGSTFPVEASAEVLSDGPRLEFVSEDHEYKDSHREIRDFQNVTPYLTLHREVVDFVSSHILDHKNVKELYSLLNGGLRLTTRSRLPVGTGLGVSSLLSCALLKALCGLLEIRLTPEMLFVASVYLENVIGIGGGWEDPASIYPGVKFMSCHPKNPFLPRVRPIAVSSATLTNLQQCLLLVHTGVPERGKAYFDGMVERYCLGNRATLEAAAKNIRLNEEMSKFLEEGNLPAIGRTMQEQWENWKVLSGGKCTNAQIEMLFKIAHPFVYGVRMNGAGAGGCAMFLARKGQEHGLKRELAKNIADDRFYDWRPAA